MPTRRKEMRYKPVEGGETCRATYAKSRQHSRPNEQGGSSFCGTRDMSRIMKGIMVGWNRSAGHAEAQRCLETRNQTRQGAE